MQQSIANHTSDSQAYHINKPFCVVHHNGGMSGLTTKKCNNPLLITHLILRRTTQDSQAHHIKSMSALSSGPRLCFDVPLHQFVQAMKLQNAKTIADHSQSTKYVLKRKPQLIHSLSCRQSSIDATINYQLDVCQVDLFCQDKVRDKSMVTATNNMTDLRHESTSVDKHMNQLP